VGGCQRRERVTFEPAAMFLKVEAIVMARMVGLPVAGSQSLKYSGRPKGRPATSAGRVWGSVILGKVVLRVQRDSRRSMRRAIMADS
jgi:hypothetical protein